MQLETVLDRVDALLDRETRPGEPLAVGGDAKPHSVRLLDHRRDLDARDLSRLGILERDRPRSGRHQLDEVGAAPDLLARRLAHLLRPVRLAVHGREMRSARGGGGQDPAAGEDARTGERAELDRTSRMEQVVAERADVTERCDAHAQHRA